ncbi:hypothetical protein BTH42_17270 [Burkholderia sp. SRS-W-2-2016]|uniref:DUF488 domain-containing protein n=1 Tax=Burkholderia sp. SRS-W-2-2016 TaxID=1926878 RepID=UPI00094AD878|nr:DUF488 domain-containing protein [Burkholderia sp. SRS-W-2-2016]OLL30351.1 hypothetical protein BTH42_17270 [Burkholderia sp. SRS-W-2-2016]
MRSHHNVQIKRIYEPASPQDGARVLVDRVWPRGIRKERAGLTLWLKEIAPSTKLRQWFNHDPERWEQFQREYRRELDANDEAVSRLRALCEEGPVTLVYGARDEEHNQAVVLQQYVQKR